MASYNYTFQSGDGVTPTRLNDARTVSDIVNADVSATAAIAGTKIAPAFGAQDITVSTANRSITNTGNFALSFGTNNTERVRITNDGLVGIGTGSPLARLSIDRDQASTVTNVLTLNNAGGGSGNGAALNFYASTTAQPFTARINTVDNGNFGFDLVFSNKPSGSAGAGALTERMRIDASGNVGIGTSSPGNKLDVIGDDVVVRARDIRSTGQPSAAFQASNGKGVTVNFQAFDDFGVVNVTSNHRLELRTNNAIRLNVKSTGQVRFMPLASDPAGGEAGDVYYNSATNKLRVYNGSSWVDLH